MTSKTPQPHPVPEWLGRYPARLAIPIIAVLVLTGLALSPTPPAAAAPGQVSFVAAASTSGNRTAHTVRTPADVRPGDVLLLSLTTNSTNSTVTPTIAGWTPAATRDGDGIRARLWTKVAGAQDAGANVTATTSAAAKSVVAVSAYRSTGASPTVTAVAGGSNAASTSHVSPAITAPRQGSWLVSYWSEKSSTDTVWTAPSSVTQRGTAAATGSGKISAVWGDSAGAVPTGTAAARTATTSTSVSRGATFAIVIDPGDLAANPPAAAFTASCDGLTCSFDASGSTDPDGDDLTYSWDFGDGAAGTGRTAQHTYASNGQRTVRLTVDDGTHTVSTTRQVNPSAVVTAGSITHVATASTAGNRAGHSVTVPTSVRPGDRLLLFLVLNSTSATIDANVPGWTLLDSRDGDGIRGRVWTRSATASDAGSVVNVPSSSYVKSTMSVAAYRSTGAAVISASAVGGANSGATSHTTPAATVLSANSWLVSVWGEKSSTDTTWTLPSGTTSRTQAAATGNGKVSSVLGDSGAGLPVGPQAGRTATTSSASTRSTMFTVVIDPGVDTSATNKAPVAEFATGCAGLTCELDASLSYDLDGDPLTYLWDFGDGSSGTGVNPEHRYATPGSRTVRLTVDDGHGHTAQATATATAVLANPPPGHAGLVPDSPRTNQPTITTGEIWDIEVVGNRVYVAGTFTSIRQPNNGTVINQSFLAAYNWSTGQVDTGFRPTFTNGGVDAVEASPDGTKLFISGNFGTVNGVDRKAIARIDPVTGAPITSFTANANGKVNELAVTNSTVYAGGRFTTVNNVPRGALAALDPATGQVRADFVNNITGGIGTNGDLAVQRLKLTHDEGRLLVVHTGRQVNGQDRYGVAIINTRTNKLTPWKTTLWEDNLQFVGGIQRAYGGDVAPDDSYFVVVSGSGGDRPPINDTVIKFALDGDSDAKPQWISRHFDSIYSVAATEAGIYIGGHFQWAESATAPVPWPGLDDVGYGTGQGLGAYGLGDAVVKRYHLAALDPGDGHALEWFAPSQSYEGDKHIEATPRGLFVGGDGNTKGGYNVGRVGFFDFASVAAQNGTQTVITGPIEGRIKPVGEAFEVTGTATAASGVQRVELEIMDRSTGRYLNDDLSTWGSTTTNTFNATLDPGTGPNRTWRLPITMTANRELIVRARAVASNGTADNTKATKKFETFGLSDQPPNTSISGPSSPVSARTFTITGTATDDIGVRSVSFTLRDSNNRYLQADGTVSATYSTFRVDPDVVGATSTTWSYEITVPYEDEWVAQARATDSIGQADLGYADRRWIVAENGQPPTVSITQPAVMVPPTAAQTVTVTPGQPVTFSGSATDDEALSEVWITLRNTSTGERLAADGSWGANVIAGSYRISPANLNQASYNWSYTTPFNLSPGTYTFTVSASDRIGLSTTSSNQGRLTLNAAIPDDSPPNGLLNTTGTITGGQVLRLDLAGTATDDKGVAQVKVALQERDSGRYLLPNGSLSGVFSTINAVLASPEATSTTWTLGVDLPVQGDWAVTAYAVDTAGQQDPSTTGATARYQIYPGDRPPVMNENLLNPIEGTTFPDGKIFVSGRAEDDQAMASVEVGIVNAAGQYMGSSGTFTSTNPSWRTAFLNSPGTPGSNFSYTTPVIPPGAYTVRVRATDQHGFVSTVYERHATVTHPPNDPPVASFTTSCVDNVCTFDARGSTDENATTLTYSWSFGNGSGSGPVPTRTYTTAGTYTVTLTARDEWGATASATRTVTITVPPGNRAPVAVLNAPACSGLSCNFSAVGSRDPDTGDTVSYSWVWGDGTPASTGSAPAHVFPAPGTYRVVLTVTDGWGVATTVDREVTITAP
ncbi:PKD domain-containing protein [Nocardioides sp. zg-536]|uniref:PKD domain-containing protein n=1 Tax=Nocardioides faecalis TaxID=2803858 RepID=A0A938Y3F7_9ACTN|nr:PKD domain-containing protein [Nocardioides faecalis]MBM9458564.1 PKD domain-containing protein [Nocardioides faecalis]QVI58566.1 PKD domain-containing protein [Nocardioides faecalis]